MKSVGSEWLFAHWREVRNLTDPVDGIRWRRRGESSDRAGDDGDGPGFWPQGDEGDGPSCYARFGDDGETGT